MRVFTLILLFFLVTSVSAESIKIGYIDTEMVVNNLTKYKEGKTLIASEFEVKKQELLDLFNHIELIRSNKVDLDDIELQQILDLELSSFRVTLERSNIMLHHFLTIYKYLYGEEYKTDSYFLDIMRELYNFTLKQYVEAMAVDEDQKVIVKLYRKTKIQLIN